VYTQRTPQLIRTVHKGRANTAMGRWESVLSDQDIENVVAYIRSLRD
jgi:cytochrome c553